MIKEVMNAANDEIINQEQIIVKKDNEIEILGVEIEKKQNDWQLEITALLSKHDMRITAFHISTFVYHVFVFLFHQLTRLSKFHCGHWLFLLHHQLSMFSSVSWNYWKKQNHYL
jgi:hypothetical protein